MATRPSEERPTLLAALVPAPLALNTAGGAIGEAWRRRGASGTRGARGARGVAEEVAMCRVAMSATERAVWASAHGPDLDLNP